MVRLVLYFLAIVLLGGCSAWIGQRWRSEGLKQESAKQRDGELRFEQLKTAGDVQAQTIFANKEQEGKVIASDIVQRATELGRIDEITGQGKRTHEKEVGQLTTAEIYLIPRFANTPGITALEQMRDADGKRARPGDEVPQHFDDLVSALAVLRKAQEETRAVLDEVRFRQTKGAVASYVDRRKAAGCRN